jgi:hypothetical protein
VRDGPQTAIYGVDDANFVYAGARARVDVSPPSWKCARGGVLLSPGRGSNLSDQPLATHSRIDTIGFDDNGVLSAGGGAFVGASQRPCAIQIGQHMKSGRSEEGSEIQRKRLEMRWRRSVTRRPPALL